MATYDPFADLSTRERFRIINEIDERAIARMAPEMDPEAIPIMLHKVRYETIAIEPRRRHESREWLESRGYGRHHGLPWPPKGELDL